MSDNKNKPYREFWIDVEYDDVCEGSIEEWEQWTGMQFPDSGDYVIADALVPIQIDREMNIGRYVEPNVWVHHPISSERLSER